MKKLLVATSALVAAAGSAAALDVTLGGEISISADLDMDNSGFNGADWGAGFTLKASGESMGWTYGGTLEFGMFSAIEIDDDAVLAGPAVVAGSTTTVVLPGLGINPMAVEISAAKAYMGGDFMGKISFQDSCGNFVEPSKVDEQVGTVGGAHCIEWTGLEMGGIELKAAIGLDAGSTIILGAAADISGVSLDAEYDVMDGGLDVEAGLATNGLDITLGASWNGDDSTVDDEFDWSVAVGTTVGDFGVTVEYAPEWRMGYRTDIDPLVLPLPPYVVDGTDDLTHLAPATNNSKDLMIEVTYGDCWTADLGIDPVDDFGEDYVAEDSDASDNFNDADDHVTGDMFGLYMWEVGYECDLHDGFELSASIGQDEVASTQDLGGVTGSIGATVSF